MINQSFDGPALGPPGKRGAVREPLMVTAWIELGIAMKLIHTALLSTAVLAFCATPALADPVGATLLAQYFQVADGSDGDFPGPTPTVLDGSSLGSHGLPVGTGSNDIDPISGEVTWWSPALNANVVATGTATITLPYASNMFAPNSTGSNDGSFFETAILTGNFTLAGPGTVSFTLGSDDDSFIYIDGVLFGQNPGIHGVTTVNFTTPMLTAGDHQLKVFYADRENVAAYLSLSLNSAVVVTPPSVPEPASWAMMLGGFGLVGGAMRSRRRSTIASYS